MRYDDFFSTMVGAAVVPFGYQRRLAEDQWPDVVEVPTGMGKTAAVIGAWLYRRLVLRDAETPRRLVYCLPMRALVEQTARCATAWTESVARELFPASPPQVHVLMGGSDDIRRPVWPENPESEMILVGTQEMLLCFFRAR